MKDLFRKNALSDVSSPEQLGKYIRVVHPAAWVAVITLLSAVIGTLYWAFTGSLVSGTTVNGVLFPEGGMVNVNAVTSGYISEIRVSPGDYVQAGDLLAVIPQDDIIDEIISLKMQEADKVLIENLINEYRYLSYIYAKHSGRITAVAEEHSFAVTGGTIASIMVQSKASSNQQVLAFVPAETAKNLKLGMQAQVSPNFAHREEYGYMLGYISSVGSYPITSESIDSGLLSFVKNSLPETGFIEVRITLLPDAESDNLIKWSNEKGRKLNVDMGTACKILIITDTSRPIDRLA